MPSSSVLPSLLTVVDLFLLMPPRKRDCRKDLPSAFGPGEPSLPTLALIPKLFIRKKFLNFWGKWLFPLLCLLDGIEWPEKFRFSEEMVEEFDGEPKMCVMEVGDPRSEDK